ncbi:gustatory receptor for sugar taste 64f-like [Cylas formicarius]|uniref:gustatory receptor for sugar taste 64f-like n=1 Tax=Cylas formicarius TaxID=197179 RepID=UPI0029584644|nr:gustatory receptor for sugar taste 64f-like [Cylas formicarius]
MGVAREILDYARLRRPEKRKISKDDLHQNTLQASMKVPIILMQIFGFFPLDGICGPTYKSLQFRWLSLKLLYSVLSIVGYTFNFVLYCLHLSSHIENILDINALFFHIESIIMAMLFLHLATKWSRFVKQWHNVEIAMKNYEPPRNLKRKISITLIVFLGVALVEHGMMVINRVVLCFKFCHGDWYAAWYEYFANRTFYDVFIVVPYRGWGGALLQFLIVQKTFIWNFVDIFVVLISTCFTVRLKQITIKATSLSKTQVTDVYIWKNIREDYIKLSKLCDSINDHLSWFIMISYATNIYHILSQLFSSLKPKEDVFEKIYFFISFFLLIMRITSVCIFGGGVYDEKAEIAKVLTSVPSSVYNIEVERFITHLATCEMVLTGKNFFRITRNLILQIASAIVSYELVLIQFNLKDFKNKTLSQNASETMRVLRKIRSNTSLTIEQDDPITIATPTFHESIRFALVMAQIFGIMPLYGTTVATTKKLQDIKFEWVSLKMVFALFHIIGTLAAGVFCMLKMALHGFVIDETAIMVFYMMNGFCAIHYIYLAAKWRTILKEWTCVEISMKSYRNAKNVKRINIFTTVVFMFFGIIEHTLYILSAVQTASKCDNFKKHPVEIYFGCSFPHYFTLLSYNHWAAAVVEFSNFLATFTWNFTDLFIILISISLREKFNQISDKIRQSKNVHDKFWKTIREDHLKVSNLTRAMDSHIAAIVLFSFINNIFFLCIQLYNSIK